MPETNPHLHLAPGETTYWRTTPHVFVGAHWGPEYCALCNDPKRRRVHLDPKNLPTHDPRVWAGRASPTGNWSQTWWKVEGWNADRGACSYGFDERTNSPQMDTMEAAQDYARHLMVHGDSRGTRFESYAVVEYRHTSVCTTLVHPVTAPKEASCAGSE